jgi:hypothetical protein
VNNIKCPQFFPKTTNAPQDIPQAGFVNAGSGAGFHPKEVGIVVCVGVARSCGGKKYCHFYSCEAAVTRWETGDSMDAGLGMAITLGSTYT